MTLNTLCLPEVPAQLDIDKDIHIDTDKDHDPDSDIDVDKDAEEALYFLGNGDMRRVLELLQAAKNTMELKRKMTSQSSQEGGPQSSQIQGVLRIDADAIWKVSPEKGQEYVLEIVDILLARPFTEVSTNSRTYWTVYIIKSHPAMGYYLIQVDICDLRPLTSPCLLL